MIKLKKINHQSGFTLIELILYIALVSIFISGAIFFAWDVIYGREKVFQQQMIEQNGRAALSRVAYEIRRAKDIQSVAGNQIVLDNDSSTTTIFLLEGAIQIITEGAGPYELTSNQVKVTSLSFTDLTSSNKDTKGIAVNLTLSQAQTAVSAELTAQTTMSVSVELNSQFNQSRSLLLDASGAYLSPNNRSVLGITIQNTGSSDIVLDQLTISWTGTGSGENVTEIQIGGGSVEWAGSQGPGSTIDFTNFDLTPTAGVVDIDNFDFDSSMANTQIELEFGLSDGSISKTSLTLSDSPDVSPTPTPTSGPLPTPTTSPGTCLEFCTNSGYGSGTCRQNAQKCSQNGETYESGGNQYCTGGPSADTCCCAL